MATRQSSSIYACHRVLDARVVPRDTDVEESAVGIDNCDACVIFLAPGEIKPNEVHGATVPDPGAYRRKL